MEAADLERNCELSAELHRLVNSAPREGLARDAGRKAEIVFNPGRSSRLAADSTLIEYNYRKPLGGGIHGGRKSRRTGADNRNIIDGAEVELRRDAETDPNFRFARMLKYTAVWTNNEWQLVRPHCQTFHHSSSFALR